MNKVIMLLPIAHKKVKRKDMKTGKYVKGFYFLNKRKMGGNKCLTNMPLAKLGDDRCLQSTWNCQEESD